MAFKLTIKRVRTIPLSRGGPVGVIRLRLKDKVAVVTGGATGIGRSICEVFAREGARVVLNYNSSADAANEVVTGIAAKGGEAYAYQASVSAEDQVKALLQAAVERWGGVDILINNAGWSKRTPHHLLDELTEEIWDRTLNTNLRGTFYCTRAAAPLLKQRPGASVINVASIAPYTGQGSTTFTRRRKPGLSA